MNTEREQKRAVSITRVSSDSQADNTSHEEQYEVCTRYAASQGWRVVMTFAETESGMGYSSRTKTQTAIEMMERDEADVFLLYNMSRYGRDVEYQHKMLKRIVNSGKQLQFASFPLEYDPDTGDLTPESHFMFTSLGGTSSFEGYTIRKRLRAGKMRKISQGVQVSRAYSPFGWHIVAKKDVIRGTYPPEAEGCYALVADKLELVKTLIFEARLRGDSLGDIASEFNRRGIPTPAGGKAWNPTNISGILRHPIYKGLAVWCRTKTFTDEERLNRGLKRKKYLRPKKVSEWVPLGKNPVQEAFFQQGGELLIGEAMWDACQESLLRVSSQSGPKGRKYLLTGLLVCPACGKNLYGQTQKNGDRVRETYRCAGLTYWGKDEVSLALRCTHLDGLCGRCNGSPLRRSLGDFGNRFHRVGRAQAVRGNAKR